MARSIQSLVVVVSLLAGCSGAQPTVESAEVALRVACAALAEAVTQGTNVPHQEVARTVCDPARTREVMAAIVQLRQSPLLEELAPLDERLWEPLPPEPARDAGP